MITVLTGLDCFCPEPIGVKDIIICGGSIMEIAESGTHSGLDAYAQVINCDGLCAYPGIIDQHIHLIGGGGENGFASRIGEISIDDIFLSGITTVVGVLGFDSYTKSLHSLLAHAGSLESQGLTAYIYTGSYAIPTVTVTGSIANDLILIDKIIGTGEIAISDARSSLPTFNAFAQLAAETHTAGMISGKAGVVHIHVGDGKEGLAPLRQLLDKTDLPKEMFVPTHVNRSGRLFEEAMEYCASGGNIDLTAGETIGIPVPQALRMLLDKGLDLTRVTVSSDANGSSGNEITKTASLYQDIKNAVIAREIPGFAVLSLVTENVAKVLRLWPRKGVLREGSDADILVTDKEFHIQKLFCKGRMVLDDNKLIGVQS